MNTPLIIMPDGTRIALANIVQYHVVGTAIQFQTIQSTSSYFAWDPSNAAIAAEVVHAIDWFVSGNYTLANPPNILDVGRYVVDLMALDTTTGAAAGGTVVNITGTVTNFQPNCVVTMNGLPCATTQSSATACAFTTRPQNQGGANPASIILTNPDGTQYHKLDAFTWT